MGSLMLPVALMMAGMGLALLAALYLFCTLKADLRAAERRIEPVPSAELQSWERRLESLETRAQYSPPAAVSLEPAAAEASTVPIRPGMNLSRRSQALRLARRGEKPEQIASRLGLATGEVRLLLKIHGMLVEQAVRHPRSSDPLKSGTAAADISSSAARAFARAVLPI